MLLSICGDKPLPRGQLAIEKRCFFGQHGFDRLQHPKVAEDLPERIRLVGLAAGSNAPLLLEQCRRHQPKAVSISEPAKAQTLREALNGNTRVFSRARKG